MTISFEEIQSKAKDWWRNGNYESYNEKVVDHVSCLDDEQVLQHLVALQGKLDWNATEIETYESKRPLSPGDVLKHVLIAIFEAMAERFFFEDKEKEEEAK